MKSLPGGTWEPASSPDTVGVTGGAVGKPVLPPLGKLPIPLPLSLGWGTPASRMCVGGWGASHTGQGPSPGKHTHSIPGQLGWRIPATFPKTLDHSAPDASVHAPESPFPGPVARVPPRRSNPDDQTLISEDRRGALLSEGRGNQKLDRQSPKEEKICCPKWKRRKGQSGPPGKKKNEQPQKTKGIFPADP